MKKFLALVLALVMTMSLVTISAGAEDFTDETAITYGEAVDVISALGIVGGYADGSFNPTGTLTRGAAAKIICNMVLGPTEAGALATVEAPFKDVPADHVFSGYIAYCASEGIVGGYADGTFRPAGTLTGYAFMKMLLCALGYDADAEGYTGTNFSVNVAKRALNIGLNKGLKGDFVGTKALTREEACLYALNALQADMVEYDNSSSITIGDIVISNNSKAETIAISSEGAANYAGGSAGAAGLGTKQFCEAYFATLRKDGGVADDFGRAAVRGWYLDKNLDDSFTAGTDARVCSVLRAPVVTYTGKVTSATVASDLKGYYFGATKLVNAATVAASSISIDGGALTVAASAKIADAVAALTANGKVVEIYANTSNAIDDLVILNYTVETIDNVTTNATTGDVTYDFSVTADKVVYADPDVADTVKLNGTFAKGDVVTTYQGTSYLHVYPTTKFSGAQSAYNTTTNVITVGGAAYKVATGVAKDAIPTLLATGTDFATNSTTSYNYWQDQYGYIVKTSAISNIYSNYAQVISSLTSVATTLDGATPSVSARFLLADGTVADYTVKLAYTASTKEYKLLGNVVFDADLHTTKAQLDTNIGAALNAGTVYAYSLEDSTITLQAVATTAAASAAVKGAPSAAIATGATYTTVATKQTLLDGNTIYVLYNATTGTATQYVGALPTGASLATGTTQVVAACNATNTLATAKVVFGVSSDVSATASSEYAYVKSTGYTVELIDGTTYAVYTGTKADGTTVTLTGAADGTTVASNGLYTWNSKNQITGAYSTGVIGAQDYTVVGSQMVGESSGVYNMADAQVIYVDTTRTSVHNSNCVVVVARTAAGVNTNNAVAIFVVGAAT